VQVLALAQGLPWPVHGQEPSIVMVLVVMQWQVWGQEGVWQRQTSLLSRPWKQVLQVQPLEVQR
jgi:hypothetical protein